MDRRGPAALLLPLIALAAAGTAAWTARREARRSAAVARAAAEQQRRRLARDLHDGLAQELAGLRTHLLLAAGSRDPDLPCRTVLSTAEHLGTQVDEVRRLIIAARPASLDDGGLLAAIHDLARRPLPLGSGHHAAPAPRLHVDADDPAAFDVDLSPTVAEAAYRVVQEAVTNAVRHGRASHVDVHLRREPRRLHVRVTDDGTGFDPGTTASGVGLPGQAERAAELGGRLRVDSRPGHGTTLALELPLRA